MASLKVSHFLAVCCLFTMVHYITTAPALLKIYIHHTISGRYLKGSPTNAEGLVTASGVPGGQYYSEE